MSRRWWPAVLLVAAFTLTACIGQVSRSDFDKEVARRGNGMTDALVDQAFAAFAKQFPGGRVAQLSVGKGSMSAAVPLPGSTVDLDGYRFDFGATSWRRTAPVRVSGTDDITAELFDPLAVSGLRHLRSLVETTVERSSLSGAVPTSAYVDDAATAERHIRVTVDSDRGSYSAQFTLEGVFVDGDRH
ncbi:hypothetical protein [Jongsikchunia kroppenstedtii]|uniref:hypothetical protein n=1 Tax=Jongsikchunia kroppenstedtii TaxID=1121721 RepID=UPI00037F8644|nr:hypothetical protein [Jongsikchunia kroppenstedtii]